MNHAQDVAPAQYAGHAWHLKQVLDPECRCVLCGEGFLYAIPSLDGYVYCSTQCYRRWRRSVERDLRAELGGAAPVVVLLVPRGARLRRRKARRWFQRLLDWLGRFLW